MAVYDKVSQRNVGYIGVSNTTVFLDMDGTGASIQYVASGTLLSVTNSPGSYGYGTINETSTSNTGLTHFTLENDGTVPAHVTVHGDDWTGASTTWTLSDTATPGDSVHGLKTGLEGGSYSVIVKKTAPYNTLKSDLAVGGNQGWGLQLLAPTIIPSAAEVSGTITLTAVAV